MPSNRVTIQSTNTGQLTITVPRAIAEMKGWKKGTVLELLEDRYGDVMLKEVRE
jgi:bifunctional DNA-binding transcriptional regulator/antitoxin component of YhaV-PrlF toxin-antitoxin module